MKATLLGTVSNHNNSIIHGLRKVTNVLNWVNSIKIVMLRQQGSIRK